MSPDTLLHWHCHGSTYSVKRVTAHRGLLIVSDPGGGQRRREIPISVVLSWRAMGEEERCRAADRELGGIAS